MKRILAVDDEPPILAVVSMLLRSSGFDVVSVDASDRAGELLKSDEHFDLVLSDMRMRPLSGMDLLRICAVERPDTPFIMLTAYGSREAQEEAASLGAVAYLSKPFNPDDLLMRIRQALGEN